MDNERDSPGGSSRAQSRWGLQGWSPAYFALVMATGIVSLACQLFGMRALAVGLFAVNWIFYVALWLIAAARLARYPRRMLADLLDHRLGVGFFTWVAATGVLASQCLLIVSWVTTAEVLWWIAVVLWLGLIYTVFAALTVKRNKPDLVDGLHGGWLVAVVATQAISSSASLLAAHQAPWIDHLHFIALVTWLAGGMLYIWLISIIFYRYTFMVMDPEHLSPLYWVNMGAMAISTLAGSQLIEAAPEGSFLAGLAPFLTGMTLLFWATATWWIPMLIILGVWRHAYRRISLRYDPLYWGAVFPLGMYTVCTFRMAKAIEAPFLLAIPRYFIWVALAAWALTVFGLVRSLTRRALHRVSGAPSSSRPETPDESRPR